MDILEPPCDLQQQVLQLQLRQVAEPPVVLGDDVRQRAAVAVLVLDEHVVVLCPRRVVAHHVGVLAQHGVRVHLPQGVLPVGGGEQEVSIKTGLGGFCQEYRVVPVKNPRKTVNSLCRGGSRKNSSGEGFNCDLRSTHSSTDPASGFLDLLMA